jgi:hypothetical protein
MSSENPKESFAIKCDQLDVIPESASETKMEISQPSSRNRILDYENSMRMQFSRDEWDKRKKNPGLSLLLFF